jgi:hypothetical protein
MEVVGFTTAATLFQVSCLLSESAPKSSKHYYCRIFKSLSSGIGDFDAGKPSFLRYMLPHRPILLGRVPPANRLAQKPTADPIFWQVMACLSPDILFSVMRYKKGSCHERTSQS